MSDIDGGGRKPRGWSGRVQFSAAGGGVAYVPGQVITTGGDAAVELANSLGLELVRREELGAFTILELSAESDVDVLSLIADLRDAGFTAQPNHVFFADCASGCGCACPPHPSAPCGPGASPVYASPVYASPVYASPVYASPVHASPVYASPVYASPVYASPSWSAAQQATGIRASSARSATGDAVAEVVRRLEAAQGGGPRVVVLDTGLAAAPFDQPLLASCVSCDPQVADDVPDAAPAPAGDLDLDPAAGHGTFIAGLILQVAPQADIRVHRVLTGLGDGDEVAIARAIFDLVGKVDVLNLSFSGYTLEHPALLAAAVRAVQRAGGVVVASAGNDGTCRPTFPAALPEVVGVGAVGPSGPAPFTNFGPWVRACAPGVDLVSTFFRGFDGTSVAVGGAEDPDRFDGYARWSGTSFAAPLVAGALAREMATGITGAAAVARLIDGAHLLRIPGLGTVVNVA